MTEIGSKNDQKGSNPPPIRLVDYSTIFLVHIKIPVTTGSYVTTHYEGYKVNLSRNVSQLM